MGNIKSFLDSGKKINLDFLNNVLGLGKWNDFPGFTGTSNFIDGDTFTDTKENPPAPRRSRNKDLGIEREVVNTKNSSITNLKNSNIDLEEKYIISLEEISDSFGRLRKTFDKKAISNFNTKESKKSHTTQLNGILDQKQRSLVEIRSEIYRLGRIMESNNIFHDLLNSLKFLGTNKKSSSKDISKNTTKTNTPSLLDNFKIPNPLELIGKSFFNFLKKGFNIIKGLFSHVGKLIPWLGLGFGLLELYINADKIGKFLAETAIEVTDTLNKQVLERALTMFGYKDNVDWKRTSDEMERLVEEGKEVPVEMRKKYNALLEKIAPDADFKVNEDGVHNKTNEFEMLSFGSWFNESKNFWDLSIEEARKMSSEDKEHYRNWLSHKVADSKQVALVLKLINNQDLTRDDIDAGISATVTFTDRIIEKLYKKNYIQVLSDYTKNNKSVNEYIKERFIEKTKSGHLKHDEFLVNHQNYDFFKDQQGLLTKREYYQDSSSKEFSEQYSKEFSTTNQTSYQEKSSEVILTRESTNKTKEEQRNNQTSKELSKETFKESSKELSKESNLLQQNSMNQESSKDVNSYEFLKEQITRDETKEESNYEKVSKELSFNAKSMKEKTTKEKNKILSEKYVSEMVNQTKRQPPVVNNNFHKERTTTKNMSGFNQNNRGFNIADPCGPLAAGLV